jgi:hypothetical protein
MELEDGEQRQLADPDREDQKHHALLAASARLIAELESLLDRSQALLKKLDST